MDTIFKALNDAGRRALLDSLRRQDGQTLTELSAPLEMSRFGVMKHLGLLEEAGLVTTVKRGRFKHHYLNPVPLQQLVDRWIDPLLAGPATRGVLALKARLEGDADMTETVTDAKPDFVLQTYIRCRRAALWAALRDPEAVAHYHFVAAGADRDGAALVYRFADGRPMLVCTETVVDEAAGRLETTFEPKWAEGAPVSRVVYRITEDGPHCCLTIEHYGLPPGFEGVADGWARTVAGLKTWLETGQAARFPVAAAG